MRFIAAVYMGDQFEMAPAHFKRWTPGFAAGREVHGIGPFFNSHKEASDWLKETCSASGPAFMVKFREMGETTIKYLIGAYCAPDVDDAVPEPEPDPAADARALEYQKGAMF